MKLYLDLCCFGRLADAQDQPRVRLEAESVLIILRDVQHGRYDLVAGEILDLENENNPDSDQKDKTANLLRLARHYVVVGSKEKERANILVGMGFRTYDAFHVASAETAGADYFLSTDRKVVRLGAKYRAKLAVSISNPVEWLRGCRQ